MKWNNYYHNCLFSYHLFKKTLFIFKPSIEFAKFNCIWSVHVAGVFLVKFSPPVSRLLGTGQLDALSANESSVQIIPVPSQFKVCNSVDLLNERKAILKQLFVIGTIWTASFNRVHEILDPTLFSPSHLCNGNMTSINRNYNVLNYFSFYFL